MSIPDRPPQREADGRLIKHPLTAVCVGAALLLHGLYIDVVAADVFFTRPVGVACLVVGMALSFLMWRRNHRNGFVFGTPVTRAVSYLTLPPLVALFVWMVFSKSIPWTAAVLFGSPHTESHPFTLATHRRKGCDHRAEAVHDLNMFPNSLCVNEDYVRRHGHRIVLIRLVGDRTPLGFRITRIEHEDVLGAAPPGQHDRSAGPRGDINPDK